MTDSLSTKSTNDESNDYGQESALRPKFRAFTTALTVSIASILSSCAIAETSGATQKSTNVETGKTTKESSISLDQPTPTNSGTFNSMGTISKTKLTSSDKPYNPETEKYQNRNPEIVPDNSKFFEILKRYLFETVVDKVPEALPLQTVDATQLSKSQTENSGYNSRVTRLGHSTILIEMDGQIWLTDPVFSERASPVQWMGPKRFHPVPMDVDKLEKIDGILISHNHYDHLDEETVKKLQQRTKHFLVPEGIKTQLTDWGVDESKVTEFSWWEQIEIGSIKFVSTPAQHFSGRGLTDGNKTLWSSWVIQGKNHNIFFSGDTGYFDGFKEIGERFGPFDLTLMETGAYDPLWAHIHMSPEQTLQAHMDLNNNQQGRMILPIHNSTFDLAMYSWYDPLERLEFAAQQNGALLTTPLMGEPVELGMPRVNIAWWKEFKSEEYNLADRLESVNNDLDVEISTP